MKNDIEIKEPGIIFRKGNEILYHSKELNPKSFEKLPIPMIRLAIN